MGSYFSKSTYEIPYNSDSYKQQTSTFGRWSMRRSARTKKDTEQMKRKFKDTVTEPGEIKEIRQPNENTGNNRELKKGKFTNIHEETSNSITQNNRGRTNKNHTNTNCEEAKEALIYANKKEATNLESKHKEINKDKRKNNTGKTGSTPKEKDANTIVPKNKDVTIAKSERNNNSGRTKNNHMGATRANHEQYVIHPNETNANSIASKNKDVTVAKSERKNDSDRTKENHTGTTRANPEQNVVHPNETDANSIVSKNKDVTVDKSERKNNSDKTEKNHTGTTRADSEENEIHPNKENANSIVPIHKVSEKSDNLTDKNENIKSSDENQVANIPDEYEAKYLKRIHEIAEKSREFEKKIDTFSDVETSHAFYYIDENLQRNIEKLDRIDVNDSNLLREERKNAIKYIYSAIDRLEKKAKENENRLSPVDMPVCVDSL